jgi:site-specific recombinase XerD
VDRSLRAEIDAYLDECRRRRLRDSTLRGYTQTLEGFARSLPDADPPLSAFTLEAARTWQDGMTGRVSSVTVADRVRGLRLFGAWVADEGWMPGNPVARLRVPFVDRRMRTVPTDEELDRVIAAAAPPEQILLLVLASTGMRVGDLCRLCLPDLLDHALVLRDTKTRTDRLVPLDPQLRAAIHFYAAELRPIPKPGFEDRVFLTRRGQPYRPELIAAIVRRLCDRAGLGARRFTTHALRHWFARDLIDHGTNPLVAAARGGWKTLDMLVHYAQVGENAMRADVARYAPGARIVSGDWRSAGVSRYAASSRSASSGRTRS